jgi:hypothetical protein
MAIITIEMKLSVSTEMECFDSRMP